MQHRLGQEISGIDARFDAPFEERQQIISVDPQRHLEGSRHGSHVQLMLVPMVSIGRSRASR